MPGLGRRWVDWVALDVLINNAGISGPTARIEDIAVQEWDQTVSVNLKSQYLCIRRAVPVLRRSERAAIINMSSVAGTWAIR